MEFDTEHCEVCNKPLTGAGVSVRDLPPGVKASDVYSPREDHPIPQDEDELEIEDD